MEERIYLVGLHFIGITQKKFHQIFDIKKNYREVFTSLSPSFLKDYHFTDKQISYILDNKSKVNLVYLENILKNRSVKIVTIDDPEYPGLLKQIPNKPYLFYLRGVIDNSPKISVVGSRKITSYGQKSIENIVGDISNYFTIVSGGAAGCDTSAHKIVLEKNSKTISVIGTGIDQDYPVGNKELYDEIVEKGGGVLSIFPLEEMGNPYNFPVRNELVAGLSLGVLVIEAKEKSGTLITANLALDLGKDLFAIPGDIHKISSVGCINLIKTGSAKLTTCSQDILEEYNINNRNTTKGKENIKFADKIEEKIYNLLISENYTTDDIKNSLDIDISILSLKLSLMEINGIITKRSGGKYEII